ncbi:MAG: ribonuclease H-like domain-containing protein [Terriglobia bacterium]
MTLDEKLRRLKRASSARDRDRELEQTLEYLRRLENPQSTRKLPAQRFAKGIEEYVEGQVLKNSWGEFFLAREVFPFGRPYGKLRIGDIPSADLSPLNLVLKDAAMPDASRLVFLDTETTGLAGGTGTCAFLIGIGNVEGMKFVVRQFFLRDYPEEKAMLEALAEILGTCEGIVTFNGKTFDVPLLETRYALARMKSPLDRLVHFDALHPARRLWKLRLESCKLTNLEEAILGISREGDVPGSEIPAIYFDYLRSGDARGLQPVFYHNALDVVSLAALTVELARALGDGGAEALGSPLDLFSLSRILGTAGSQEKSISTCRQALAAGLPQPVESLALKHLAAEFKRKRQHESAVELWLELSQREPPLAVEALEELAIHYEHRLRDIQQALEFTLDAVARLDEQFPSVAYRGRFTRRLERLKSKLARASSMTLLR